MQITSADMESGAFSPLQAAEAAFCALADGPRARTVDGMLLGDGFPQREIPLRELKAILLHPSCGFAARDAAWRFVVGAARSDEGIWAVVAVGLALPGLKRIAARLPRHLPYERAELEQELLAGFLEELAVIDLARERIVARLCAMADRDMRRALYRACARSGRESSLHSPAAPAQPSGHPDFVLARAVAAGIINAREAEVIGRTRLEDVDPHMLAAELGFGVRWLYRMRSRAEQRLAQAISEGRL